MDDDDDDVEKATALTNQQPQVKQNKQKIIIKQTPNNLITDVNHRWINAMMLVTFFIIIIGNIKSDPSVNYRIFGCVKRVPPATPTMFTPLRFFFE